MSNVNLTRVVVEIEHVTITTSKPFAETATALEASVPQVDDGIWERLENGDAANVRKELEAGAPLLIFVKRDHGSTDQMIDYRRNCFQYEIGNPLTASKMTSNVLATGLYAPLRIVLYENEDRGSTFEYDLPSAQFGQFDNADVLEVGKILDEEIEKALKKAAN